MPLSNALLKRMNRWGKNITHPVEKSLANLAAAKLSKNDILLLLEYKPVMMRGLKTIRKRTNNLSARNNAVRAATIKYGHVNRPSSKRNTNRK